MDNKLKPEEKLKIAETVRSECIREALEAYEYAKLKGLCEEGAWESAVDAMKNFKLENIIDKLSK